MQRIIVFIVVAAFLLTPLDYFQFLGGIRNLGENYWQTPLIFGALGGLIGLASFWLDPKPHPAKLKAVICHGIFFVAAYLSTLISSSSFTVLMIILFDIWIQDFISRLMFGVELLEIFPFIILLGMGAVIEWVEVKLGRFSYLGFPGSIPIWLPFLWISGAFFTRSLVGKENKEPHQYKWLGPIIVILRPILKLIAMMGYTVKNVKRLGCWGSWKMARQLYK